MRIGIDIDDVLVDSVSAYISEWETFFGSPIEKKEIYNPSSWKSKGIPEGKIRIFFDEFFEEKAYQLEFIEGAKEALIFLLENHEPILITSRPPEFKEKTKQFFEKHFPKNEIKIHHSEINLNSHSNKPEGKTKADICVEEGVTLLIEDHKKYALGCGEQGIHVFLFDQPWNQDVEDHEKITRVKNWKEILEKLQ